MTLSEDVKQKIIKEFKDWEGEKQALLTIQTIEKFDNIDGVMFDLAAGTGSLIAACVIAGKDANFCYANEPNPEIRDLCEKRLNNLDVPSRNILPNDSFVKFVKNKTKRRFGYFGPSFEEVNIGDASDKNYLKFVKKWMRLKSHC